MSHPTSPMSLPTDQSVTIEKLQSQTKLTHTTTTAAHIQAESMPQFCKSLSNLPINAYILFWSPAIF